MLGWLGSNRRKHSNGHKKRSAELGNIVINKDWDWEFGLGGTFAPSPPTVICRSGRLQKGYWRFRRCALLIGAHLGVQIGHRSRKNILTPQDFCLSSPTFNSTLGNVTFVELPSSHFRITFKKRQCLGTSRESSNMYAVHEVFGVVGRVLSHRAWCTQLMIGRGNKS